MGDDDGWMAVVLGNRLPQPGTRYPACLVNLEGQYAELPADPPSSRSTVTYVSGAASRLRAKAAAPYGDVVSYDAAVMNLPGTGSPRRQHRAATGRAGRAVERRGATWHVTGATGARRAVDAAGPPAHPSARPTARLAESRRRRRWTLGRRAVDRPRRASRGRRCASRCWPTGRSTARARRLPVPRRERQLAAARPRARPGPETPDGDPVDPDTRRAGPPAEPPPTAAAAAGRGDRARRDSPTQPRRGERATAWFRGPLAPTPVDRAGARPDGAAPLAHHADQLRRVVPDGPRGPRLRRRVRDRPAARAEPAGRRRRARPVAPGGVRRRRVRPRPASAIADAPGRRCATLSAPDPLADGRRERAARRRRRAAHGARGRRAAGRLGRGPIAPARPLADPGARPRDLARGRRATDADLRRPRARSTRDARRCRRTARRGPAPRPAAGRRRPALDDRRCASPRAEAIAARRRRWPKPAGRGAARPPRARDRARRLLAGRERGAAMSAHADRRRRTCATLVVDAVAPRRRRAGRARSTRRARPRPARGAARPAAVAGPAAAARGGAVQPPRRRLRAAAAGVDPLLPPRPRLDRRAGRGRAVGRHRDDGRPGGARALYAVVRDEVDEAERLVRLPGWEPGAAVPTGPAGPVTGFLLRSRMVSGWPALHVRAYARDNLRLDAAGRRRRRRRASTTPRSRKLGLLRLERLAPAVLLALFDGVPQRRARRGAARRRPVRRATRPATPAAARARGGAARRDHRRAAATDARKRAGAVPPRRARRASHMAALARAR